MNRVLFNILILAIISFILGACNGGVSTKEHSKKTVRYKREQINQNISIKEAYEMINRYADDTTLVLIDIRSTEEFEAGVIKDAILLEYKDPELKEKLDRLDREKIYILYCRTGGRSGITLGNMKSMGFWEAYNLTGGIVDWEEKGYSVVKIK